MMKVYFLRHFETEVDPFIPVHDWKLSDEGRQELMKFIRDVPSVEKVYTSPEVKALEAAELISEEQGIELEVLEELSEVDRTGEGFIEDQDRYHEMVEKYLGNDSVEFDWEAKSLVRERFRTAMENVDENALVVTHGLLLSINLAEELGEEPHEFWNNLEFGETIEMHEEKLQDLKQ